MFVQLLGCYLCLSIVVCGGWALVGIQLKRRRES